MGAEQSMHGRSQGANPLAEALFTRAMLEALEGIATEDSSERSSEMYEHAWNPGDRSPCFRVLDDRLTARRLPSILTTDCIRGKKGYRGGRHVWEIRWEEDERGTFAIVGVATPRAPLQGVGYAPIVGVNLESWGWDIVNKTLWHGGKRGSYPAAVIGFQVPDVFFVILDMNEGTLSFSTSDVHLGVAFTSLPKAITSPMCPIVNAIFGNCDIRMRYMGRGESIVSNLKPLFPFHRSVSEHPSGKPAARDDPSRRRSTGTPPVGSGLTSSKVDASSCYKFAHQHGQNVAIMYAGKKAKRIDPLVSFNNAVAVTSEPLKDNKLFEVRLDSKVNRWMGGIEIGATTNDSNSLVFPQTMSACTQGGTFIWSGNAIQYNANMKKKVIHDIDDIAIGDRVGVMRKPDHSLHFYLNGENIGSCFKTIPDVLYGVVDVYGQAEEVTITGGTAETQSSNDTKSKDQESILIMVQMKKAIDLLKLPIKPALNLVIVKLNGDVLNPYIENDDRAVRRKYGDHLAEIGTAQELKKLLDRLDDMGLGTQEGWVGIQIVYSILWNYSDASMKLAKEIGKSGLFGRFASELKRFGPSLTPNEKRKYIVDSAINILHNCAKATENRQVFRNINAVQIIAPFLKSEDSEIVISSLLTLSYITDDSQKNILEADTKTIGMLRGMLVNAANDPKLRGRHSSSTWSALEIVTGISNIAVNEKNSKNLIDIDIIPVLFDVIDKGGSMEKECSATALWSLANLEIGKRKIRAYPAAMTTLTGLSKNSNKSIAAAAERVLLRIKPQPMQQGMTLPRRPRENCPYKKNCRMYMAKLDLSEGFFDNKYDKCFCTECHESRNQKLYYTQGKPAKDYAVPIGWCRFSLKMDGRAVALNANSDWHVAYHGTAPSSVKPILHTGQLLFPGDTALGGKTISVVDGHFDDDRKPEGFNIKQVFVSPSIRYSGLDVYAKPEEYNDSHSNKAYKVKTAFQLWIKPESYKVGPQTILAKEEIDPKFSNQEVEWSTVERGAIFLYGVLVRMDEK